MDQLLKWWSDVQAIGPNFGYYPKPYKTWLVVKSEYLERANEQFHRINITDQGHKYLGSYIGSDNGKAEFMTTKVEEWTSDVEALAKIAQTEPQLAYAAYVYGTSKRWSFVSRTTPNIAKHMRKLEYAIKETLIPDIVGKNHISDDTSHQEDLKLTESMCWIKRARRAADPQYDYDVTYDTGPARGAI